MALRRLREHTVGNFVPIKEAAATMPEFDENHLAGDEVPKGGSMCANCKYLEDAKRRICGEKGFIKWQGPNKPAGSPVIPLPIDRYCSDFYKAKPGLTKGVR